MIVEARELTGDDAFYFDVNFAPKNGGEYTFMWLDGRRKAMVVRHVASAPAGVEVLKATFDVPSHEIYVQSGR